MDRQTQVTKSASMHRNAGTRLSGQLLLWVVLLSLTAILSIVFAIGMGLWGGNQFLKLQSEDAALQGVRLFDDFMGDLSGDLVATGSALSASRDIDAMLRSTLARNSVVFELSLVRANGQVVAAQRRVGQGEERIASQPWLATVRAGDLYVGEISYEQDGMPFVDLAVPVLNDQGDFWATLLARVDLTVLWDGLVQIKVGQTGYVYVVDEMGRLLIYRDLQPVLRGETLQQRGAPAVQEIIGKSPVLYARVPAEPGATTEDTGGSFVITGMPLTTVPWYLVVEQPLIEVARPFIAHAGLPVVLFFVVVGLVYGSVRFVRRRIVTPLRLLHEGVTQLGAGEVAGGAEQLGHRVEIQSADEFGDLAFVLNRMADRIQKMVSTLELHVAERAEALAAAADVSQATTVVLDPNELVRRVAELVRERFGLYYVGLFMLDERREFAILRAGTGEAGRQMLERGHQLQVGGVSMIGRCIARSEAEIQLDVGEAAVRFDNPLLPDTRSELALPMRSRGQVIGAMTVQSSQEAAFDEAYVAVLQTMADQVAIAIDNARLFVQMQNALLELQRSQERYLGETWTQYVDQRGVRGYAQRGQTSMAVESGPLALGDEVLPQVREALTTRRPVTSASPLFLPGTGEAASPPEESGKGGGTTLTVPIVYQDQLIGALGLWDRTRRQEWSRTEIELVQSVAEQFSLAAENLRLIESTQQREALERITRTITDDIRGAISIEDAVQRTLKILGRTLGLSEMVARIGTEETLRRQ